MTSTVSLVRGGGYSGTVVLSADGVPAGVTATFAPTTLSGSATNAIVSFDVGPTVTPGTWSITVRANGPGVATASTQYTLTIPTPAFTLTTNTAISVRRGMTASIQLTVARSNGFTGDVSFVAEGLPSGVSANFSPATLSANMTTGTLTFVVGATSALTTTSVTVRASGAGAMAQTAAVALTVTAAASYALSSAAITVPQGGTGTSTITIDRNGGFTGPVGLSVRNLPTGVTATISPAQTTGPTAVLTLTAAGNAATGAFTATLEGAADGLLPVNAQLSGIVTPSGSGGINVTWRFCSREDLPAFVAYRSGTSGAWIPVSPVANNSYGFSVSGVGSAAVVFASQDLNLAYVVSGTAEELGGVFPNEDCTPSPSTLTGSFTSLAPGQVGRVFFGGGSGMAIGPSTSFSLDFVRRSVGDLLALRYATTVGSDLVETETLDRVVFRRNVSYSAGSTIPAINFAGPESFGPAMATYTIGNAAVLEETTVNASFINSSGLSFPLGSSASRNASRAVLGIPGDRLVNGEFHLIEAEASSLDGTVRRSVSQYNRVLANRTLNLGSSLAVPTITATSSGGSSQIRVSSRWQSEYGDFVSVSVSQFASGINNTSWFAFATRSYFGSASTFTLELPDLRGLPGFDNRWTPRAGVDTEVTTSAIGNYGGNVIGEGVGTRDAERTRVIVP